MEYNVYATFTKKDGFIYRTNTYIQIGESEEIIGSYIMCNPGSARLLDKNKQRELENYEGENECIIEDKALSDGTIKQIIKILKGSGLYENGGRFHIHNVFTLRNPKMNEALQQLNHPNINFDLLYKDYSDYLRLEADIPFTIIGWGCKDNLSLNKTKRQWLHHIDKNQVLLAGKKHNKAPHYYHPLPPVYSKQLAYVDDIVDQLESLMVRHKI